MNVVAPDGRTWTVRRRWLPRWVGRGPRARLEHARQRRRQRDDEQRTRWYDWFDLPLDIDSPGAFVVAIVLAIVLVVLLVWGVPLLLAAIDLLIVLLVAVVGVVSRVLFRRPWTVEAVADDGERRTRPVVGWFASGRAATEWAQELQLGRG